MCVGIFYYCMFLVWCHFNIFTFCKFIHFSKNISMLKYCCWGVLLIFLGNYWMWCISACLFMLINFLLCNNNVSGVYWTHHFISWSILFSAYIYIYIYVYIYIYMCYILVIHKYVQMTILILIFLFKGKELCSFLVI